MPPQNTPEAEDSSPKPRKKSLRETVLPPNHQAVVDALHILFPALQTYLQEKMNIAYDATECIKRLTDVLSDTALTNFQKNGWKAIDLYHCLKIVDRNSYMLQTKADWEENAICYIGRMMYYRNLYIGHFAIASNPDDEKLSIILREIATFCHPIDKKKEKKILSMIPKKKEASESLLCTLKDYFTVSKEIDFSVAFTEERSFDVTCFCVKQNKMLPDENYIIFYNHLNSPENEIQLTINPSETLTVFRLKLRTLPEEIRRLIFTVTISTAAKQNMTELSDCHFTITQQEKPALTFRISGMRFRPEHTAAIIAEIYREEDNIWKLSIPVCGMHSTLEELINQYGGSVID